MGSTDVGHRVGDRAVDQALGVQAAFFAMSRMYCTIRAVSDCMPSALA